jgi:hypothetical protein
MDPQILYFVLVLPDAFASIQQQLPSFSATIPHASSQGPQSLAATTLTQAFGSRFITLIRTSHTSLQPQKILIFSSCIIGQRLAKLWWSTYRRYDLQPYLEKRSFVGHYISTDDKRKSEAPADELLLRLTKSMKQEDACFTPVHEFNELHQQRKFSGAFISDMTLTRGSNSLLEAFVHNDGKGPYSNTDS